MSISGKMYYWGEKAKNVPGEPGVYALYDGDQALIYIGESANLRDEFAKCLDTNFSGESCKLGTKYYRREFTQRQEELAKELLREYRQKYGKFPPCNHFSEPVGKEVSEPVGKEVSEPVGKEVSEPVGKEVSEELGFHFYNGLDQPLLKVALNLHDFESIISTAPIASIEFHQRRGDFATWIRDVLKNVHLADGVDKLSATGDSLRRELLDLLKYPERTECPACGIAANPIKTWKMAGRPSRTGERLQLKIGYYKCSQCHRSFRRVLEKEKIKAI
jgi:hypothetical protein